MNYPNRLERVHQFSIYPYICEMFGFKKRYEFRDLGNI